MHSLNCQVKYSDGTRPITSAVPKYHVTRHSLHLSMLTCDTLCLPQFPPNSEHQNCRFGLTQTAGDRGAGSHAVAAGLQLQSAANLPVPLTGGVCAAAQRQLNSCGKQQLLGHEVFNR